MNKKYLSFLLSMVLVCTMFLAVLPAGCGDNGQDKLTYYSVKYLSETGGKIEGEATQTVESGKDAAPVTAVADDGYNFKGWSDGKTEATRTDLNVTGDIEVTAKFSPYYTVNYVCEPGGKIEGEATQTVESGKDAVQVTAVAERGFEFKGWSDGKTEAARTDLNVTDNINVTAKFSSDKYEDYGLPVISVYTENDDLPVDKENYVSCTVNVTNDNSYSLYATAGIRLRGNSTMSFPKKPYRIKFDKKQGLFGWEKNKSWVLLALYQDFSNIKDYAAFSIANAINGVGNGGSAFVSHAKHVELYMNGEYQGIYLLCDQIQENSGRVDVEQDFTAEDVEVPFLVELDEYAQYEGVENVDWFKIFTNTNYTAYFNIKYPEADQRFTQAQYDYIHNYILTVDGLCRNPNVTKAQLEQYVDLPSFIDYFLAQEIMGQEEINKKSVYMSKKPGGKLVMGPVWDFDWSAGGCMSYGGQHKSYEGGIFSGNNWFGALLKVEWFNKAVENRVEEIRDAVASTVNTLKAYKSTIAKASNRNSAKWHFDNGNTKLPYFNEYYDTVLQYISERPQVIINYLPYRLL